MGRFFLSGNAGRPQRRGEEIANAVSHGAALVAALAAGYWLVAWGRSLSAEGFAGAALTTLLGVGAELAAPENRQNGNRIVIAGRDSAQDSINQVGQEMTRRNMNIQPTLTERPGLPVRIIVNRDLVLRPYQPMFFNRGAMR